MFLKLGIGMAVETVEEWTAVVAAVGGLVVAEGSGSIGEGGEGRSGNCTGTTDDLFSFGVIFYHFQTAFGFLDFWTVSI